MTRRRPIAIAALAATVLFSVSTVSAIPAFARKYQQSCSTCHAPFPRLKPFGEEFAARGFRMPAGQEPPRATYDVGDPLLKLPRELPLAVRLEGFAAYNQHEVSDRETQWPSVFKLISGGSISDHLSYYLYFIIEDGDVIGLEDAFVQWNDAFKWPLDVVLGQFQVSDLMFKRELRLERFDYDIYKTRVGQSMVSLTYERGLIATWRLPAKMEVAVEVVNGNGIDDPAATWDRDKYKNLAARFGGSTRKLRMGLFGYWGRDKDPVTGLTDRTWYLGPDLAWEISRQWALDAQYLIRRDDDPFFTGAAGGGSHTRGGFGEILFFPKGVDGRWALSALYSRVDSADPLAEAETASLTMSYLLARNARLVVDFARDLQGNANRGGAGLVIAF